MPVRLDPFQNIVGVNWGGIRLINACTFRVDYRGPAFGLSLPFSTVAQMTTPDQIEAYTVSEGLPNNLPPSAAGDRFVLSAGTGVEIGFHEFGIRPIEDAPDPDPEVQVRIFALPIFGQSPGTCDIKVRFGFGPVVTMSNQTVWYASRLGFDLSPANGAYIYPRNVPFIVNSQFQEIRDFNGVTRVIRSIPGIGTVSDFGTLQLNFQRGTMAYVPPEPPPED
jgi:hypothetical protein